MASTLLPFDLVEIIIYKLPVASLLRFKSTCKQWCALINDKRFIYKHLKLSREGFIRVHDHKLYQFINLETLALSTLQGPSDIYSMIHCDGLLLCEFKSKNKDRKFAVWNPFLRRVNWIKPSSSYNEYWDICGFGYDRDNYKILRFCKMLGSEDVEIYEFKTQLWRRVDYSCAYYWCPFLDKVVSMDGNMYWIAQGRKIDKSPPKVFIQCFDFSREIFKETCCLPFINHGDNWFLSGSRGDSLSLLSKDKCGNIELWVTNNVTEEVVSWSKYFYVTAQFLSCKYFGYTRFFIHKTKRIMLWCEEKEKDVKNKDIYFNVYEIGEGVVEKRVETGRHRGCDQASFSSLVIVVYLFQVWFRFQSKRRLLRVALSFMHVVSLLCSSDSMIRCTKH